MTTDERAEPMTPERLAALREAWETAETSWDRDEAWEDYHDAILDLAHAGVVERGLRADAEDRLSDTPVLRLLRQAREEAWRAGAEAMRETLADHMFGSFANGEGWQLMMSRANFLAFPPPEPPAEEPEAQTAPAPNHGWTDALRAACNSRTVELGDQPCWQDSALPPCLTCWDEAQEGEREDG